VAASGNAARRRIERLSREAWLEKALASLASAGHAPLRVGAIAAQLEVTKGSFYHHFENRADFVRSIVDYWEQKYTRDIASNLVANNEAPEEWLWALIEGVAESRLTRFDVAIRAWASHDQEVRKLVARADKFRMTYVRSIFSAMGFKDSDLEARTRAFVTTVSAQDAIYDRVPIAGRQDYLKALHRLFIQR
jgi:AcrR family transcriptional regulator